ncbi:hypothetical protein ACYPKM_00820 [Pseudomonas aeruginosa]
MINQETIDAIRQEFERLITSDSAPATFSPVDLKRCELVKDNYLNNEVQCLWKGFMLARTNFTAGDISELREAIAGATQGTWRAGNYPNGDTFGKESCLIDTDLGPQVILAGNGNFPAMAEADIGYVVAAQPSVVEKLLDDMDRVLGADYALWQETRVMNAHLSCDLDTAEYQVKLLQNQLEEIKEALKPFAVYESVRSAMGSKQPKSGPLWCAHGSAGDAEITVEDMQRVLAIFSALERDQPADQEREAL